MDNDLNIQFIKGILKWPINIWKGARLHQSPEKRNSHDKVSLHAWERLTHNEGRRRVRAVGSLMCCWREWVWIEQPRVCPTVWTGAYLHAWYPSQPKTSKRMPETLLHAIAPNQNLRKWPSVGRMDSTPDWNMGQYWEQQTHVITKCLMNWTKYWAKLSI